MSAFRVETIHGRHLLCGGIIPRDMVKAGQEWAPADGGNYTVNVTAVSDDCVHYTWGDGKTQHQKDNFAFQCRYCLVLPSPELPEWAQ